MIDEVTYENLGTGGFDRFCTDILAEITTTLPLAKV